MADQPRCLCVVASNWLRSREFIAALRTELRPQDPVAIILDRRRGGSLMESGLEDRRRQPLVDLALATDGFAIVPASVDPNEGRTLVSLLLPEVAVDALLPTDVEDQERLASVRRFLRRRSSRRIPKLGAAFLKGLQAVPHFVKVRHAFPILTALLAVLIGATLATLMGSPAAQNSSMGQPPGADRPIAMPPETSPPLQETGTVSRETGGHSNPGAVVRPSLSAPTQSRQVENRPSTSKAARPRFAGSPRAVLAGEPVSLAWGNSYAVRLMNSAGHPMAGAEVWLVARRTDGTGENIPMGALPEPGTYRATVPSRRSALVDLRVRVSTGNKRVEVPVKP